MAAPRSVPPLQLAAARVDLGAGAVHTEAGDDHQLTPTELALLAFLAEHPGQALGRDTLLQAVWGYRKGVKSRTLDTAVKTLRRKVERDPRQPDHIHTVRGIGYRFEPQRRAPAATSGSLLGRDAELARTLAALQPGAVVTLVGPAGIGKTTLARGVLAVRSGLFVDLSAVRTDDELLTAIAAAVAPGRSLGDAAAVHDALANLQVDVWVLDNVEQCLAPVHDWLSHAAAALPRARWLLTSRAPLDVPGETVVPVGPLASDDAVALLVARGAARRAAFAETSPRLLAEIAAAVDGVPLALELVAARAGLMEASALRDRLVRLDWLRDEREGPRHRSLGEAVAWSWSLLDDGARSTLAACALFAGPFDAEAVEAVVGDTRGRVLDDLDALRAASLVERSDGVRLRLLVMVRAFAAEQLTDRDAAEDRLADWLVTRLVDHEPDTLLPLRDTVRDLVPGQGARRPLIAARLCLLLELALASTGPMSARRAAGEESVRWALASGDDHTIARAHLARARGREALGTEGVEADLVSAREAAERDGDPGLRGKVLGRLGTWRLGQGLLEAADEALLGSLALLEQVGDRRSQADRYSNLGQTALLRSRYDEALERYRMALALHEEVGNRLHAAKVMGGLGTVYLRMGRHDRARRWWTEAMERHRALGHRPGVMRMTGNVALLAHADGRLQQAEKGFAEVSALAAELGEPLIEGISDLNRTAIALERGDDLAAERHAARSRTLLERVGARVYLARTLLWEAITAWVADEPGRFRATLDRAIEGLHEVGDRTHTARAIGLRKAVFDTGEPLDTMAAEALARDEPLTAEWLALCDRWARSTSPTDREAIRLDLTAFAAGSATQESDLRIQARLLAR